jgi:hypothetical protein
MAFKLRGTGLYKRTASKNGNVFKHTAKFGANTSFSEIDKVDAHNKKHKAGGKHTPNPDIRNKDSWMNVGEWTSEKEGGDAKKPAMKKAGRDKFTEGTIPAHVKKAFPNLTQAEFDKDRQGYNKKAMAKLKAGEGGPKKYKK